ncbi:MAG TPA: DMT family transporter [Humisphaera sp.]
MPFPTEITGPALSLATAALWAVSPVFMASAGRKVGAFPVLLIRSLLASVLLAAMVGGLALLSPTPPAFPDLRQAGWIALSGFVGVGVGDILIYEAFVALGPRRTTQTLVLAPAVTVLVAWTSLGEELTVTKLVGVGVTLAATSYAVFAGNRKPSARDEDVVAGGESGDVEVVTAARTDDAPKPIPYAGPATPPPSVRQEPGRVTPLSVAYAVAGAVCMAVGAVMARHAFRLRPDAPPDALPMTLVRVAAASAFLWLIPLARGRARGVLALMRDRWIMARVGAGTMMGPIVGMLCYVGALKAAPAGLVSTLVATSPLFAIPVTVLRYRVRIGWGVILAACAATGGVALIFLA